MKRFYCILVSMILVLSLFGCGKAKTEQAGTAAADQQKTEKAAKPETVSETPVVSEPVPYDKPSMKVPMNDIYVIYTNDVHCGIDDNVGYSAVAAAKKTLEETGADVFLVDCGDYSQGSTIGVASSGSDPIEIMNSCEYDIATLGNHEFDYGIDRLKELMDQAEFSIVCCNIKSGTADFSIDGYKIMEAGGMKIAFVGILSPSTVSSKKNVFRDPEGNMYLDLCDGDNGRELYDAVQKSVDMARLEGADYVIALAHLGLEAEYTNWRSEDVIKNTTGIDILLDGHDHRIDEGSYMKNKDGKNVLVSETGKKLANYGILHINTQGTFSTGLVNNMNTVEVINTIESEIGSQARLI